MPKGIYKRTVYNLSETGRQSLSDNLQKARAALLNSPRVKIASSRNASNASSVRSARAILKAVPLGAAAGVEFVACRFRRLTVIDTAPVSLGDGKWKQDFRQSGSVTVYGVTKVFSGIVRIVWDYEPTLENIMDKPTFEEVEEGK